MYPRVASRWSYGSASAMCAALRSASACPSRPWMARCRWFAGSQWITTFCVVTS
ncbi:MAG: hypothetical protein NTU45_05455 [Planctomycetota bacterium]|nr:hypothetical protein [Planctomycetota bacterium]